MSSSSLSFREKLESRVREINSLLCVGLDPHEAELFPKTTATTSTTTTTPPTPEERCDAAFTFCKTLVDATLPYTACYKPNSAFFEALGDDGMKVLRRLCQSVIPNHVPILLDVKRGDIGSTAAAYAVACYDHIGADAVTLSPLMGWDSIQPFVTGQYESKGAFLLCKTSNPTSQELLACPLLATKNDKNQDQPELLYERIASLVGTTWAAQCSSSLLGLVVGATDVGAMERARRVAGDAVWILAPGVGAQGGDLEQALAAGLNSNGSHLLIPISRGISRAENPATAAQSWMEQIRTAVAGKQAAVAATATPETATTTTTAIEPYQEEFIQFSLQEGVLKFGSFVLKSGRTSPYFFNAGLFASGAALHHLGNAYAAAIMAAPQLRKDDGELVFDVIFGPAYKGISLGAVVASALYRNHDVNVGFAYNRKEVKDHGEGGNLVGASLTGKRVLIVDDVITAGTAIRESYDLLQSLEATQVMGVVIALDRAEKRSLEDPVSAVQAVSRDLNIPVISIVNLPQLQAFLTTTKNNQHEYGDDILEKVAAYRSQYGV